MYDMFTCIYDKTHPNISKYTVPIDPYRVYSLFVPRLPDSLIRVVASIGFLPIFEMFHSKRLQRVIAKPEDSTNHGKTHNKHYTPEVLTAKAPET